MRGRENKKNNPLPVKEETGSQGTHLSREERIHPHILSS
jgi:hypothetical protein